MAPGTNTGAAHPVMFGGKEMDPILKDKMENDASAFLRSFVSKRGRNVEVAESAVRQSKSFTEQEALAQKLIDYVASDEQDLFKQMEGRTVTRFNGSTVVLRLNPHTDCLEMFCDVGLPEVHAREAAYRAALEINLCRSYPGITLGVHPESGRMVATVAIHSLLVADDEVCLNTLDLLTRHVDQLRMSRAIPLSAED